MKTVLASIFLLLFSGVLNGQSARYTSHGTDKGIDIRWAYGVAFVDYDNDGDEDIYVSSIKNKNALYQNDGTGNFTNVAAAAGLDEEGDSFTSGWGDFNNDGWIDVYLATGGNRPNKLYMNKGDGTFEDVTQASGTGNLARCRFVLLADVDMDGLLDIYLPVIYASNYLYHNNGDGTFTNIIDQANANDFLVAMGGEFCDYDNDGDPDLYLTHDNDQAYILYNNDGTGHFTDVSEFAGVNYEGNGMGTSFGDFNNDGFMDIYVTNLYPNNLFVNNQDGTFTDIATEAGVADEGMSWGLQWLDYNNDGWQDIYMVNDSYFLPYPNLMYHNNGNNTFTVVSTDTPLESMKPGYGTAVADVNNDGRLDIFVTNLSAQVNSELFINDDDSGFNWLKIKLEGTESNRSAIGARVIVEADGLTTMQEIKVGGGYSSQNSMTLHFGLANAANAQKVTVRWPNGFTETYENLLVNTTYKATEKQGIKELGTGQVTALASSLAKEISFSLYPNPVATDLNLRYELKQNAWVQITLLTTNGKEVFTLANGHQPKGTHQYKYAIADRKLAAGTYFLKVASGTRSFAVPVFIGK